MSSPSVLPGTGFGEIRAQVRQFVWRPDVRVTEVGSPSRIAAHSLAIEAELTGAGGERASGRLILLHAPDGDPAWAGEYRCVSLAEADVDAAMAADPALNDVGWSWLTEALTRSGGRYVAESGTVTTTTGRSFGGLAGQPDQAGIEIRCSWTPILDSDPDIRPHLAAWQDLLCLTAGLAPTAALPGGFGDDGWIR